MKLFNKIPFRIHPSFWILSFFIGFLNTSSPLEILFWMFVVLLSVVVHELGHALSGLYLGKKVSIELTAFGGLTSFDKGQTLSPLKEFLCILMGPLAGFLLAAFAYIIPVTSQPAASYLYLIVIVNLVWSMLNLLPVHPLDGGKLMSIVFENFFGHAGLRFSYLLSALFALLFGLTFMVVRSVLMCSLFLLFAFDSFRAFKQAKFKGSHDVDAQISDEVDKAVGEWLTEKPNEAIARLEATCQKTTEKSDAYMEAVERLAHYLIMTKQPKKAFNWLIQVRDRLSIQGLALLQLSSFEAKEYQTTLDAGQKLFVEGVGGADSALLNAYAAAQLNNPTLAVNWLKSFKNETEKEETEGEEKDAAFDMQAILKSEEFNPIRATQPFQDFQKRT